MVFIQKSFLKITFAKYLLPIIVSLIFLLHSSFLLHFIRFTPSIFFYFLSPYDHSMVYMDFLLGKMKTMVYAAIFIIKLFRNLIHVWQHVKQSYRQSFLYHQVE